MIEKSVYLIFEYGSFVLFEMLRTLLAEAQKIDLKELMQTLR